VVVFTESAHKHGFQEEDFYEVLEAGPVKLRSQSGLEGVYEFTEGIMQDSICTLPTAAKQGGM
jgi:hypothetical protein